MDRFITLAIEEARLAAEEGGVPIAAILVRDEVVIASGRSRRIQDGDPIMHAELDCLRNLPDIQLASGATMFCTAMPCMMCAGALVHWGISTLVCGYCEGITDSRLFLQSHGVKVVDFALQEPKRMVEDFFRNHPEKRFNNPTRPNLLDQGFTHVALPVSNLNASIAFYQKYAAMKVVQRRPQAADSNRQIAWLSDLTRPFVLVLSEATVEHPLGPFAHLGVACGTREEVDRLAEAARQDGRFRDGPHGAVGEPAGYFINLLDPDGHTLELSFGQYTGTKVEEAKKTRTADGTI